MSNRNLLIVTISTVSLWLLFITYQTHRLKLKETNASRSSSSTIYYNIRINHHYQGIDYEQNSRI